MTAVDWIILQLKKEKETLKNHFEEGKWNDDRCSEIDNCLLICEQAKQMQEEQIIDAYKHGQNNEFSHLMVGKLLITGEDYYNQTYKTQAHDGGRMVE